MKNFPRIFPYQLIHDDDLREKSNESFERGYRTGKRDAIESLRNIQAYDCKTLTEDEHTMVMRFLIENNLEFGFNVDAGGFYVIKKHKPNTLKFNQDEFNEKAQHILDTVVIPQVERYEKAKEEEKLIPKPRQLGASGFAIDKYEQRKLLEQIMAQDQEAGLYDIELYNTGSL
jgi:hypothetical protein